MTVYVAEIKGRGIAAFHADNGAEAERLVRDRVFRDDLMVLASTGLPLWDGVAGIQVRQAAAPAKPSAKARSMALSGATEITFDIGDKPIECLGRRASPHRRAARFTTRPIAV